MADADMFSTLSPPAALVSAAETSFPPHASKLFRTRDQSPFPGSAFLVGGRLVTELVDFTAGHLGCFGRALAASGRRRRLGCEGAFDEAADRFRLTRFVHL
jgi:hypothetical protein